MFRRWCLTGLDRFRVVELSIGEMESGRNDPADSIRSVDLRAAIRRLDPDDRTLGTALSAANSAIASAQKAYAADLAKAKGYVKTANKYAAAADAACTNAP